MIDIAVYKAVYSSCLNFSEEPLQRTANVDSMYFRNTLGSVIFQEKRPQKILLDADFSQQQYWPPLASSHCPYLRLLE